MNPLIVKEEDALNIVARSVFEGTLTVHKATEFLNDYYPGEHPSRDIMASILSVAVSVSEMVKRPTYSQKEVFFLAKVEHKFKDKNCPVCRTIAGLCGMVLTDIALRNKMKEEP